VYVLTNEVKPKPNPTKATTAIATTKADTEVTVLFTEDTTSLAVEEATLCADGGGSEFFHVRWLRFLIASQIE